MHNPRPNRDACDGPTTQDWLVCRDDRYGFSLCYPPDWHSTTEAGRCVQFQKGGHGEAPYQAPEIDVFVSVQELSDSSSEEVLHDSVFAAETTTEKRGVEYLERRDTSVADLPAVRARFRSYGDQMNWGVEYAVRKENRVLRIYVSRPDSETESLFEKMIATLQW